MATPTHRTVTFDLKPNPNHQILPPTYKLPLLILTSHSHSPPLHPPPRLKFDIRSLANPPKNVRDAYDGTSKQLREWLVKESTSASGNGVGFVDRMDAIRAAVLRGMKEFVEEENLVVEKRTKDGVLEREEEEVEVSTSEAERKVSLKEGGEEENEVMILRVGIFCEMGRHRSVAMVEELARLEWPGWDVEVVHRNVESKKRGSGKQERRKHGRGTVSGGRVPE